MPRARGQPRYGFLEGGKQELERRSISLVDAGGKQCQEGRMEMTQLTRTYPALSPLILVSRLRAGLEVMW